MTRLILVAAGGLLLATANSPPASEGELSSVVAAPAPAHSAKPARPAHEVAGAYPRCSATVRDRCQQSGGYATRHVPDRRIQYAMRAGERG
jgi:hypothetical protein